MGTPREIEFIHHGEYLRVEPEDCDHDGDLPCSRCCHCLECVRVRDEEHLEDHLEGRCDCGAQFRDSEWVRDWVRCGTCLRSWNDAWITGWTPAPSGRCPFEYEHDDA